MHTARDHALKRLDRYARDAVARSERQYDREGALCEKAEEVFQDEGIWSHRWVPENHDFGRAHEHAVYRDVFTEPQRLAWNHLQWGLDYARVAQGEMQLIALNRWACRRFQDVLPSVCDLADRESFEEEDHVDGFGRGLQALQDRYLPNRPGALYSAAPSGFGSRHVNAAVRRVIGIGADLLLGPHFPTLFFLNRGLKTHGFKPFENAIANHDDAHPGMRRLSHLHRLDESRHMATAHYISEYSRQVLETVPRDNRWIVHLAMRAIWPRGRQHESRMTYWCTVLDHSPTFATVPEDARQALLQHVDAQLTANLDAPMSGHERKQVLPTNKRLMEHADLPERSMGEVVRYLKARPETARMLEGIEIPEA